MTETYIALQDQLGRHRKALEELLRQLAVLADRVSDVGAGLSRATKELQESSTLPSERLVEEIGRVRREFAELRARGLEMAESLPGSRTLTLGEIVSLSALEALLRSGLDVVEVEEKRVATEQVRQRALAVLDGVLAIAHRDEIDFPPLGECQAHARELHRTISEASWFDLPPDTDALAEGKHPCAALLTLVERLETLDNAEWEHLRETVRDSFGRDLAAAASRGQLTIGAKVPSVSTVTGDETAFRAERRGPVTPPMATEPLAVVTSPALIEETATQEIDAVPTMALEGAPEEVEAGAAEQVEEAAEKERLLRHEVAAVYVELRGYGEFAETHKPEEVMGFLTEYHGEMVKVMLVHEGSLHAITGEDVVIVFSDQVPTQAEKAMQMAAAMRNRITELAVNWRRREYQLEVCVGIAQGSAEDIDAVVDLASRLSGVARPAQILISETFLGMVEKLVEVERVRELAVSGHDRRVTAYKFLRLKG